jgi:filamentous hemagglutinin family protein
MCFALPSVPIATSGTLEVEYPNSHTMVIKTSDHPILQYEDFQIEMDEEVHILQSDFSCVLHHVDGKNSSQILESLQSSGKVVLVNFNGVSFGSDSKVDSESLILSTLNTIDAKQFTLLSPKVSLTGKEGVNIENSITKIGLITITNEQGTTTCGAGTYPPCNLMNSQ